MSSETNTSGSPSRARKKRHRVASASVDAFRRETGGDRGKPRLGRPPLPLREKAVAGLLGIALLIPVWFHGSMSMTAHWLTLVCAALAFVWLWIPLGRSNILNLNPPPSVAWKHLRTFPLFWLGLLLLGYVTVAGFNPRYEISFLQGAQCWLDQDFDARFPAGVDAPLPLASSWKVLLEWGTVWLGICAVWGGCRHRRSVHFLLWMLALSAGTVGLVGAAHSFSGSQNYLWLGAVYNGHGIFGPFLYDNHAAAYLVVGMVAAGVLALIHFVRSLITLSVTGPQIFLSVLALVILTTLFVTRSRAGIVLGALGALLLIVLMIVAYRRRHSGGVGRVGLFAVVLFGLGTVLALSQVPWHRLGKDFGLDKGAANGSKVWGTETRLEAYEATYQMWKDAPVLGWGAGSFRYVFPDYQAQSELLSKLEVGKKFHWEHAHNDWLEALAELGLVGFAFLAAGLIWCASRLWVWRKQVSHGHLMALGGAGIVLAHAGVDFVLHNPAVLLGCAMLIVGALRLLLTETELAR